MKIIKTAYIDTEETGAFVMPTAKVSRGKAYVYSNSLNGQALTPQECAYMRDFFAAVEAEVENQNRLSRKSMADMSTAEIRSVLGLDEAAK